MNALAHPDPRAVREPFWASLGGRLRGPPLAPWRRTLIRSRPGLSPDTNSHQVGRRRGHPFVPCPIDPVAEVEETTSPVQDLVGQLVNKNVVPSVRYVPDETLVDIELPIPMPSPAPIRGSFRQSV